MNPKNKTEYINAIEHDFLDELKAYLNSNYRIKNDKIVKQIAAIARGEDILANLPEDYGDTFKNVPTNFMIALLYKGSNRKRPKSYYWTEKDELTRAFINTSILDKGTKSWEWYFVRQKFMNPYKDQNDSFLNYLYEEIGLDEYQLAEKIIFKSNYLLYTKQDKKETWFKKFLEENISLVKSGRKHGSINNLGDYLHNIVVKNANYTFKGYVFDILFSLNPSAIGNIVPYITNKKTSNNDNTNSSFGNALQGMVKDKEERKKFVEFYSNMAKSFKLDFNVIETIINKNNQKYNHDILKYIEEDIEFPSQLLQVYLMVDKVEPGKYHDSILKYGHQLIQETYDPPTTANRFNFARGKNSSKNDLIPFLIYLHKNKCNGHKEQILELIEKRPQLKSLLISELSEKLEKESVPYLIACLPKDKSGFAYEYAYKDYMNKLLGFLNRYELDGYIKTAIDYGVGMPYFESKKHMASIIAKSKGQFESRALELLDGNSEDRIFGALLLRNTEETPIHDKLLAIINTEKNDKVRDILLESVDDLYGEQLSIDEVKSMIAYANKRGKLKGWKEKWLEEKDVPPLNWEKGKKLSQEEIRFLFYRFSSGSNMNSDIEGRHLIQLLDKNNVSDFVDALIKSFNDSGGSTKFKHYTVMASLIGGEYVLDKLIKIFNKSLADKRYKFAAMIVNAIALVGSDKALRYVDYIARKYNSSKAKVAESARTALTTAAEVHGITAEQLSDRIIPNLGFENHFKSFDTPSDSYRAFINKDFKLNYFNTDNKLRKSVPKETPKEIKGELKAIEKEIKDVKRTQSGRLELYFSSERKWTADEWNTYYFNNTIMLVYVQQLLWGIYDDKDELLDVFYVGDDLGMYNVDDEEIEIHKEQCIGIVHPLHMTEETLNKWKSKLYDIDLTTHFEIVNREIFRAGDNASNGIMNNGATTAKSASSITRFLVNRGWRKSVWEAGILFLKKDYLPEQIVAEPYIDGLVIGQGGTDELGTLESLEFRDLHSYKLVVPEVIPKVFFSEVIRDLKILFR